MQLLHNSAILKDSMQMRVLTIVAAISVGLSGTLAASPDSLKRTPLLDEALPSSVIVHHVKGGRIDFAPGQALGRHFHPAPVVGVVTQGSFTFEVSGQPARTLKTGDAFYEPAGTPIEHFDNASKTQPAAINAFYLLERADEPVIEALPK